MKAWGGIFLLDNGATKTGKMTLRERRSAPPPAEAPCESSIFGRRAQLFDRLSRNIAVCAAVIVVLAALSRADQGTPAQAVFSALQEGASMEWDESLGKLTFVDNLLPQAVREVWSEQESVAISMPVQGEVVSAWSRSEPYLVIRSASDDVHAVLPGEVMALAHGLDEELIVRVRHDSGMESIYGNLKTCFLTEGDRVYEGDVIGRILDGEALTFELRRAGIPVDPTGIFAPPEQ